MWPALFILPSSDSCSLEFDFGFSPDLNIHLKALPGAGHSEASALSTEFPKRFQIGARFAAAPVSTKDKKDGKE
jgi:hypothetical protein